MRRTHFLGLSGATCAGLLLIAGVAEAAQPAPDPNTPVVDDYKITILSDSIPGRYTIGEWGYSALVEVTAGGTTKRFLFDSSDKPGTVVFNANKLGIDICSVEDIVISHNHADHTGGLSTLRSTCAQQGKPNGMKTAHVGAEEIFWSRVDERGNEKNPMIAAAAAFQAAAGVFQINDQSHEFLLPGVFLTGRIPRVYDEKTYVPATPMQIRDPFGQLGPDLIPEDQALVINTATETLVLTGCAHAGTVNTMLRAIQIVGGHPNLVLAGGLHLYQMDIGDRHTVGTLDWEAQQMIDHNVMGMLGGHCTGFERFFYVRDYVKLDWSSAAMSSVGTILGRNPRFTFTSPQAVNIPMGTPKH